MNGKDGHEFLCMDARKWLPTSLSVFAGDLPVSYEAIFCRACSSNGMRLHLVPRVGDRATRSG